jgi:YVTN family beta-propeller protein
LVTNGDRDYVSVVDLDARRERTRIAVTANPSCVALSPDGREAYVANRGAERLSIVDVATLSVTGTVRVGASPLGVLVG